MRRARVTFPGAFHHAMSRGYDGRTILTDNLDKRTFLNLIEKNQRLTGIRVLAFCLMDTHFHLVLQNRSGRMPEFFKQLNGQFAAYFRKRHGGKGYVFQDRYRSMLIQDDSYLMTAIAYVLNNPVKAGLASSFEQYPWSSGMLYFSDKESKLVDQIYVKELFGSVRELRSCVIRTIEMKKLPIVKSRMGEIIGDEEFIPQALELADRRSGRESLKARRKEDRYFEPVQKVIQEFEEKHGIKIDELNTRTHPGKRLRTELLVHLKDRAGLRYTDIIQMNLFSGMSMGGLGGNYLHYKRKHEK